MQKNTQENKAAYISLIELIIHNIKDAASIKSIYDYAQSLWHKEKVDGSGG